MNKQTSEIKIDGGALLAKLFLPHIIMSTFAKWGMMLTAFLAVLQLIFGLPFHFMWGFMLVPLGSVAAYLIDKRSSSVSFRPK
jgi:hypothetical protein